MNKNETWSKILDLLEQYEIDNEDFTADLAVFLKPKAKNSTRSIIKIDDIEYKNCRFTGLLWPVADLVYQNQEKRDLKQDKGYSNVGISVWNKGQKYIKDLKNNLMTEILSAKPNPTKVEELKISLQGIEDSNLGNSPEWLVQFLTSLQEATIKNTTYPLDYEA